MPAGDVLRGDGELVDAGGEPATPEQQQRALAVDVAEEVVGAVTGAPSGTRGPSASSPASMLRVSTSDFARVARMRATVPTVGRRYALRRPSAVRGLVVGLDTERPQGPEAAGGAGRRTPARVVRDGLPVQRFGVGDAS